MPERYVVDRGPHWISVVHTNAINGQKTRVLVTNATTKKEAARLARNAAKAVESTEGVLVVETEAEVAHAERVKVSKARRKKETEEREALRREEAIAAAGLAGNEEDEEDDDEGDEEWHYEECPEDCEDVHPELDGTEPGTGGETGVETNPTAETGTDPAPAS